MSKLIGIDLGTTNSCVAVMEYGKPVVLPNSQGKRTTPSIVAFTSQGNRVIGDVAKRQSLSNPTGTIYAVKRLIGRRFNEEGIKECKKLIPYSIVESENGDAWVEVNDKKFSPQQISSFILEEMKETAEDYLKDTVREAVITVPAYFNEAQRQATIDAGKIAGLEVRRIINEPTAAALAYGLGKSENKKIAVYDLGGGTFDITILKLVDGNYFEVLATNGITDLGGDDFDRRIVKYLIDEFKKEHGVDLVENKNEQVLGRLKEAAEEAKIVLSNSVSTEINLPFLMEGKNLEVQLNRAELNEITADLVKKTKIPCNSALEDAKIVAEDIDEVVLAGGMTRMPIIQDTVKETFGREPNKTINPDEAVAIGAAIQAENLLGKSQFVLQDVTPLTLGTDLEEDIYDPIIPRNSKIPNKKSKLYTNVHDFQTGVIVPVYQGERPIASENELLGQFSLEIFEPKLRGEAEIEVTFKINSDGILDASAIDKTSGNREEIRIKKPGGLSEDEIEQLIRDANTYSEIDKQRLNLAEAKNQGKDTIYRAKRVLSEHSLALESDTKNSIESKISELDSIILESDDIHVIQEKIQQLQQVCEI